MAGGRHRGPPTADSIPVRSRRHPRSSPLAGENIIVRSCSSRQHGSLVTSKLHPPAQHGTAQHHCSQHCTGHCIRQRCGCCSLLAEQLGGVFRRSRPLAVGRERGILLAAPSLPTTTQRRLGYASRGDVRPHDDMSWACEVAAMRTELSSLSPQFFEEVEDLKYAYAVARQQLDRFEAAYGPLAEPACLPRAPSRPGGRRACPS